jgi:hypothetical protein
MTQSTTDAAVRAIIVASTIVVPPNRNDPILEATDGARAITPGSYRVGWAPEYGVGPVWLERKQFGLIV